MSIPNTRPQVRITDEADRLLELHINTQEQRGRSVSKTSIVSDLIIALADQVICPTCNAEFAVFSQGTTSVPEFCPECGFLLSMSKGE